MLPVLRTHTVTVGVNKRVEVCGVGEDGARLRLFGLERHTAVSDGGTGRLLGQPSRGGGQGSAV
jgi:hypothetical protein